MQEALVKEVTFFLLVIVFSGFCGVLFFKK